MSKFARTMLPDYYRLVDFVTKRHFNTTMLRPAGPGAPHSDDAWLRWRSIFFALGIPSIVLANINAFVLHHEGEKPEKRRIEWDEEHDRPVFKDYSWRCHSKAFPWGDGRHSLFFNKHHNVLKWSGYEDDAPTTWYWGEKEDDSGAASTSDVSNQAQETSYVVAGHDIKPVAGHGAAGAMQKPKRTQADQAK